MGSEIKLLFPGIALALGIICAAVGVILIVGGYMNKRIRDRLHDVISLDDNYGDGRATILRDMDLSTVPFVNEILRSAGWARRLDTLLVQANLHMRVGSFLALMLFLGALGMVVTANVLDRPTFAVPVGVACAVIPVLYARRRKRKRIHKFETLFPDALDMLTSALRAGMAFPTAIQVVAEEAPDPVGREFAILFEENRLGLDMKEALRKMAERVDSNELHLFVTSVILHRETGGNLAEVLDGTAEIIRERFRILGDVRSMTAQARLSGLILMLLPIFIASAVIFIAPDYLQTLMDDAMGRVLVVTAVALQVIGLFLMKRIIAIKV